jgi:hypothetical protein
MAYILAMHAKQQFPLDLTTATFAPVITLLTSSNNKTQEVQGIVGDAIVVRRQAAALVELQPSAAMDTLRLRGPTFYGDVARESALTKYHNLLKSEPVLKADLVISPGTVLMDTSWFQVARQGFPGVLVASEFATAKMPDGREIENTVAANVACDTAKRYRDFRAVWIETFVLVEEDGNGGIKPNVFQAQAECFIPPTPQGNGWSFDVCCCPDPIALARLRGDTLAAAELSSIPDLKWDRPLAAAKKGLLMSFAELAMTGEKPALSPRGEVSRDIVRHLRRGA